MPLYLYEAAYTAESLAAQIKEPKDRIEVVKPVFEAVGGKILLPATHSASTTSWSSTKPRMTPSPHR